MSEHTFPHFRTGTFPLVIEGLEDPQAPPGAAQAVYEARWVRDHHVVHLFLPAIEGTATEAITLAALPAQIRPSRSEVFPVPVRTGTASAIGLLSWEAGALAVQAHATVERGAFSGPVSLGPCAVHYLSIPGQVQDAAGVMRLVAEGETPNGSEPSQDEGRETAEGGASDEGVLPAEPPCL